MKLFIYTLSIILIASAQEQKHGLFTEDFENFKVLINIHDRMTQDEAFVYCKERGYELINLNHHGKYQLVRGLLIKNVSTFLHYWTAGKRVGNSDSLMWSDGSSLTLTDAWPAPGHREKNCVALVEIQRKFEAFNLHTEHCNATNAVICEKN